MRNTAPHDAHAHQSRIHCITGHCMVCAWRICRGRQPVQSRSIVVDSSPRSRRVDVAAIFPCIGLRPQGRRSLWDRGDTSPQYLDWGDIITNDPPPIFL